MPLPKATSKAHTSYFTHLPYMYLVPGLLRAQVQYVPNQLQ
jgi:hypothetical protein